MSLLSFDISALVSGFIKLFAPTTQSFGLLFMSVVGVLFLNAFLIGISVIVGFALMRRIQTGLIENEKEKKEAHEQAIALLDSARKEAQEIIGMAQKKALQGTEEIAEQASESFRQSKMAKESLEAQLAQALKEFSHNEEEHVRDVANDLIASYRSVIESTKKQYATVAAGITKEMADHAERALDEFQQFLKDQTIRYEAALKTQTQQGFMSAQKEISDYKRESMLKVEEAIYRVLNLVTKSVLGRALSMEDQQDLVIHALNEAKQQAFFEI